MSRNVENPRRALGKGLSALLPTRPTPQPNVEPPRSGEEVALLPIDLIEPNPLQPRRDFRQDRIQEQPAVRVGRLDVAGLVAALPQVES